jgi:uncharacterized protein
MLRLLRGFIHLYQHTLSPLLTLLSGTGGGCRFEPTCSRYFLEAVETHGFLRGTWLGLKRLGRCQPWGGWGHDPVPKSGIRLAAPSVAAPSRLPHFTALVCE